MPDLFGIDGGGKAKVVSNKCSQCGRFISRADREDGSAVFYSKPPTDAFDCWTCADCVGANEELGTYESR